MSDLRGDHHVIKFLHPDHFNFVAEVGKRIESPFLRTSEQECAWIEELGASVAVLVGKKARWGVFGIVRLTVDEFREFGVTFSLTTLGCDWPDLEHAHGELTGYDEKRRYEILRALDDPRYLRREPDREGTASFTHRCGQIITYRFQYGSDSKADPDEIVCSCDENIQRDRRVLSWEF